MTGMTDVDCPYCGDNLGAVFEGQPIDWKMWKHRGCAGRIAAHWEMDAAYVEDLKEVLTMAIASAYPDITGQVGDPGDDNIIRLRGGIAAGYALDVLAGLGYRVVQG